MIDEIKKALAEATAGPWEYGIMEGYLVFDSTMLSRHIAQIVPEGVESLEREEANAMLIANAPTWIRYLLDQNEKLKIALTIYADESHYADTIGTMSITPTAMHDKGRIARDALALL